MKYFLIPIDDMTHEAVSIMAREVGLLNGNDRLVELGEQLQDAIDGEKCTLSIVRMIEDMDLNPLTTPHRNAWVEAEVENLTSDLIAEVYDPMYGHKP